MLYAVLSKSIFIFASIGFCIEIINIPLKMGGMANDGYNAIECRSKHSNSRLEYKNLKKAIEKYPAKAEAMVEMDIARVLLEKSNHIIA